MYKRLFYSLTGLIILTLCLSSCKERKTDGRTDTNSSGAISFASDESFSPIMDEFIQVYEYRCPNAHLTPIYTTETEAVNLVLSDSIYLAITSRRFTDAEYQNLKDRNKLPEIVPLAYDGMALICNNQNTDSCITVNDIKRILRGEVTKWDEINKGSKLGEIWLCFDNTQSSAVHYCEDSILGGQSITSPNVFAAESSKDVIDYVERTPNAIGVIGSNWLNDKRDTTNTTFKKNITVMSVSKLDVATPMNSWKPYQAWLLNGRYPFVRTIYALLNDPRRGLPWGFAHFMENPTGQLMFFKAGLLPMRGEVTIRDVRVNDGD